MPLNVKTDRLYHSEIIDLKKELAAEKELVRKLRDELRSKRKQCESDQYYQSIVQSVPDIIYRLQIQVRLKRCGHCCVPHFPVW